MKFPSLGIPRGCFRFRRNWAQVKLRPTGKLPFKRPLRKSCGLSMLGDEIQGVFLFVSFVCFSGKGNNPDFHLRLERGPGNEVGECQIREDDGNYALELVGDFQDVDVVGSSVVR